MDDALIEKVLEHFVEGHDVFFGVDYLGSASIKIRYGPFNLRTLVFETDAETAEAIKDKISLLSAVEIETPSSDDQHTSTETRVAVPSIRDPTTPLDEQSKELGESPEARGAQQPRHSPSSTIPPANKENAIDSNSVESFGMAEADIEAAWLSLVVGPIPAEAERIWDALSRSNNVTKIAFQTVVSIRECLIWICVFRQRLAISEDNSSGTYKYSRDPRQANLAHAVSQAVANDVAAGDQVISAPKLSAKASERSGDDPNKAGFPIDRWKAYSRIYRDKNRK